MQLYNGECSKDCVNAGCFVFAHSGGASAAIACEAEHPGCFAAIYAFEPGLVSDDLKAGDTKCDPVLSTVTSPCKDTQCQYILNIRTMQLGANRSSLTAEVPLSNSVCRQSCW